MKQRRIKFYSLDYLTYVNEVRIQEEEQRKELRCPKYIADTRRQTVPS